MPLIKGKSKAAFKHNIEKEMDAGKPQKQAVAIAFSVKRRARKKMAEGGSAAYPTSRIDTGFGKVIVRDAEGGEVHKLTTEDRAHIKSKNFALPEERKYPIENPSHARNALARVSQRGTPEQKAEVRRKVHEKYPEMSKAEGGEITAQGEARPMPDKEFNDRKPIMRSKAGFTTKPKKHAAMAPSDVLLTKLYDDEEDLQNSKKPAAPGKADARMAEGGNVGLAADMLEKRRAKDDFGSEDELHSEHSHMRGHVSEEIGEGPEEDANPHVRTNFPDEEINPSEDEFMANHFKDGGKVEDDHEMMEPEDHEERAEHHEHKAHEAREAGEHEMAEHHEAQADHHRRRADEKRNLHHEMDEQPEEEAENEDDSSIASAIMSKRRKMMAKGGQVDLSRNADEDANFEDDASFDALRKENYSESDALDGMHEDEDSNEHEPEHDEMDEEDEDDISKIRRRMKKRSPMTE